MTRLSRPRRVPPLWRAAGAIGLAWGWVGFAAPGAGQAQTEIRKTPPVVRANDDAPAVAATPTVAPQGQTALAVIPARPVATMARMSVVGQKSLFELGVSSPVAVSVFTLAHPYRVVIDVPEIDFDLPAGTGSTGKGLISAFRFGLFAPGRSRLVIDVKGPVKIIRAESRTGGRSPSGDTIALLQIEMDASTADAFIAASGSAGDAAKTAPQAVSQTGQASLPFAQKPQHSRFVVMIDPGHGGVDGGATSANHVLEKDLVLQVARQLKAVLDARGRYDVKMTRAGDQFVSLDQRVALSETAESDLFISIHADAVEDAVLGRTVRGATVYTLSEAASHQSAEALAEKENAADSAGGLAGDASGGGEHVNSILVDLMKRETQNLSAGFRQLLIDRLKPANLLSREPARSAAFKVLRQPQTPTVLIELGFLTNETDVQQMQTAEWQKRVSASIATAVDAFAARRVTAQR